MPLDTRQTFVYKCYTFCLKVGGNSFDHRDLQSLVEQTQQQKGVNTNGSGQYFKALGQVKTLGCEIPMPPTFTRNDNNCILLWNPFGSTLNWQRGAEDAYV